MPLQKQVMPLPVTGGINQGTSDFLRDPQSLSRGENVEQLKTGEIVKRKGFDNKANAGKSAGANGKLAFPVNNSYVKIDKDPSGDNFVEIELDDGTISTVQVNDDTDPALGVKPTAGDYKTIVQDIISDAETVYHYDVYVNSSDFVYVYAAGAFGARIYRFDRNFNSYSYLIGGLRLAYYEISGTFTDSGRFISTDKLVTAGASSVSVRSIDTPNSSTTLASGYGGTQAFDACAYGGSGDYVFVYDDGTNVVCDFRDSSNSSLGTLNLSNTNATHIGVSATGSSIAVTISRSAGNSNAYLIATSTRTVTSTANVTTPTGIVLNMYPYVEADGAVTLYATSGASATDVNSQYIATAHISSWTTPGPFTVALNDKVLQSSLASYPFAGSTNRFRSVIAGYQSTDSLNIQNSNFLISTIEDSGLTIDFRIDSKIISGGANNVSPALSTILLGKYWLPQVASFSDGVKLAVCFKRQPSSGAKSAADSVFGLSAVTIENVARPDASKVAESRGITYIPTNSVMVCDGRQFTEYGFHIYPNPPSDTIIAGTIPDATATWGLASTYEWIDSAGNVLESAPSFDSYSRTSGGGTFAFRYTLQSPPFNTKTYWRQNFYRTVADGSIYYFVGAIASDGGTTTLDDDLDETTLETNRILYTTGGVAENISPNNVNFIAFAKDRLWTFERGSTTLLWFSKKVQTGFLPAFSDLLTLQVPEPGGKLVGVAQIDDKVIILKEGYVYVTVGDGPSDTLVGEFSQPAAISQGIGCITSKSILETPIGVFFQSKEGIYLADRSLQVQFIGRPVYGETVITSSLYEPEDNKCLFSTLNEIWVYYITTGVWYKWTVSGVYDMWITDGDIHLATETLILDQGTGYQDNGSNYAQALKLGQYEFAGLQGYQRVYKVLVKGPATTTTTDVDVKTYFDNNTTATDTLAVTAANYLSGNRMALEVRPSVQKCETMELELIHEGNDEGVKISAISVEIGVIGGASRRASTGRAV